MVFGGRGSPKCETWMSSCREDPCVSALNLGLGVSDLLGQLSRPRGAPLRLLLASLEGPSSLDCLRNGGGPLMGSRALQCGLLYQGLWVRRNWSIGLCTWLIKTTTRGVSWLVSFLAGLVELLSEFEAVIASGLTQVQSSEPLEQARSLVSSPTSTELSLPADYNWRMLCLPPSRGRPAFRE